MSEIDDFMKTEHFWSGDIYSKVSHIPSGSILVQHKHKYDHLSILSSGTVELEVDGQRSIHTGPMCLDIKAGKHHGVKALTDVVWFCVHSVKDAVVDIDDVLIETPDDAEMHSIAEGMK